VIALPASSAALPSGSATVHVGDTFEISISITGAVDLKSWKFDLLFTPSIISAISVTEGSFLSESGTATTLFNPGSIDNASGRITLIGDSFLGRPPAPSGNGVLAEIEFRALAQGTSPLTLSNVFLNSSAVGFSTREGLATVLGPERAAPEPGTLALVSIGLGVWAVGRWRTSRRARATTGHERHRYAPPGGSDLGCWMRRVRAAR
jgi:Cohesin domain